VRRFAYFLDWLCLLCCGLYAANRWLIKPHTDIHFFHYWFNDCLLIPCALPPLLFVHRWLGLRADDAPPSALEIAAHVAGWSILFEVIGPHIMRTTGDPLDAVSYAAGGIVAGFWWLRPTRAAAPSDRRGWRHAWLDRLLALRPAIIADGRLLKS
jgi:hypothetical protein